LPGDARRLPFPDGAFDGVYCFGLLQEFVGPDWEAAVATVMAEIGRVLAPAGLLVLAVLAGDPAGLPQVHLFSEQDLTAVIGGFTPCQRDSYADRGCTGREDHSLWYAVLGKANAAGGGETVGRR
jgi:ubiquinone/menaquinone biosynthesis C-methylase UbiE